MILNLDISDVSTYSYMKEWKEYFLLSQLPTLGINAFALEFSERVIVKLIEGNYVFRGSLILWCSESI